VAALYKKLDNKLLSSLEFVEKFYDYSYEEYIMENYSDTTDLGPEVIEDLLTSSQPSRKIFHCVNFEKKITFPSIYSLIMIIKNIQKISKS
jgi:hypothetical protein